jgi:hypothetical protein
VYVVDKPNMLPGDESNHNYLVTDKSSENYECSVVNGIQSTYNIIVFRNESEYDSNGLPARRILQLR